MKIYLISITIILQNLLIYAQVPTIERDALIALYNATDGSNWTFNTNWNTSEPVSTWFDVSVENISGQDYVTNIDLSINNLVGYIPEEIGNFSHLNTLSLYGNQISGNIPPQIGNLIELKMLLLDHCQLSGNIPIEIGALHQLEILLLSDNQLTNSIPSEISNLTNLWGIDISNNQLTGEIPHGINNLTELVGINLHYNNLTGDIDLSNLNKLYSLKLNNNNFTQLDVRNNNNHEFTEFNITDNPNLICVFVDDKIWSSANWPNKDATAQYFDIQAECDTYLVVDNPQLNTNYYLYPNPTNGVVNISIKKSANIDKIEIYTVFGKRIKTIYKSNKIDLSNFSQGIYLIKLFDSMNKQYIYKTVKI